MFSSTHFCVQDIKYTQKSKAQELPAWGRNVLDIRSPESKWVQFFNCQRSKLLQGGLNRTHQADSPVISDYTNLKKLLVVGREKGNTQQECKVCSHIRSVVKLDTFVNFALFCFTKGPVLRDTIQWQITRLSTCSFCSLGLRSIIYSVKM